MTPKSDKVAKNKTKRPPQINRTITIRRPMRLFPTTSFTQSSKLRMGKPMNLEGVAQGFCSLNCKKAIKKLWWAYMVCFTIFPNGALRNDSHIT
jgi:hypothetical protein